MSLITLLFSLLFVDFSIAGYVLEDDYSPANFFSMFSFFTEADPTNGHVDYVDQSTAQNAGYISTTDNSVYIGTDYENTYSGGRPSVRLTSNKAYNAGSLVILDLEHMPGSICGAWPAFWMVGPDWPAGGEIDIIEGVNDQATNAMTLHTGSGCTITDNGNFSGSIETYDCDVAAFGQTANAGCSIGSPDSQSYGTGLNNIGGGVYATEWTDDAISVWFFPRGSIPSDIAAGTPNPSSAWGTPSAQFQGGCDIPQFFHDNQIVFDLTFCGDWAGAVWSSSCSASTGVSTCNDFVSNNPSAFKDAYWTINSLQVFQYSESESYSTTSVPASTSTYALSTYPVIVSSSSFVIASSSEAEATTSSSVTETSSEAEATSSSYSSTSASLSFAYSVSSSASSSPAESSPAPSSSSNRGWWHDRKVVSVATGTTTSSNPSGSVVSSDSASAYTSNQASATTLSLQVSTTSSATEDLTTSTASSVPTVAMLSVIATATGPYSDLAVGSVSTAVPTSQAEMLAKVEALAEEWATSQPDDWQDKINALEQAMEAASSQAAAVSARLRSNQRRHLLHHKRRFSGHH